MSGPGEGLDTSEVDSQEIRRKRRGIVRQPYTAFQGHQVRQKNHVHRTNTLGPTFEVLSGYRYTEI